MLYDVKSLDVCKMKKSRPTHPMDMNPAMQKWEIAEKTSQNQGIDWNTQEAFFIFLFVDKKNIGPVDWVAYQYC